MTDVRHPEIEVQLTGRDGNAFAILGTCCRAMRAHGLSDAEVDEFKREATNADYNHLLATCMKWFDVH